MNIEQSKQSFFSLRVTEEYSKEEYEHEEELWMSTDSFNRKAVPPAEMGLEG